MVCSQRHVNLFPESRQKILTAELQHTQEQRDADTRASLDTLLAGLILRPEPAPVVPANARPVQLRYRIIDAINDRLKNTTAHKLVRRAFFSLRD